MITLTGWNATEGASGNAAGQAAMDRRDARGKKRLRSRLSLLTAALLGTSQLVAFPSSALAATINWDGSNSGNWDTGANWDTNAVPTGTGNVFIDDVTVNTPVVGTGVTANADSLYVGDTGAGALTISGTGALTVTGDLYIGQSGTGTLKINSGGTFISGYGSIGDSALGSGEVLVSGAGSSWAADSISVGYLGIGALTVSAGGAVSGEGYIGDNIGSGTVIVTGANSSWTTSGEFMVGIFGTGNLTVSNGGLVDAFESFLGWGAASNGTAMVTGVGSAWTNTSDLAIGLNGTGDLTVSGGGLVTSDVATVGAFAGSTGTVLVTGAGSIWNNGAAAAFMIGLDGAGTVTIADGGEVLVDGGTGMIDIAENAGSTGVLKIGSGGGAGTLNAALVQFGAGDGSIVFNHTDSAYEFAAIIAGLGEIEQNGGKTILTGNSSGFTGTTNIYGGLLTVNGMLGGTTNILAGGSLGGSGTLASAFILTGAAIAPGNSIGTLHVAGDVGFAAGSFFDVEVDDAGNSDLLDVTGTATLNGGTVRVSPGAGNYAASTMYTILTATTVSGAFDGTTSNFAFLSPSLSYDAQNVYLTLDLVAAFQDVALTPNQFNTAGAAEALGGGNAVYDEILTMTAEDAQAAFDALSGDVYASARTAFFANAQAFDEALLDRLRLFGAHGHAPKLAYASLSNDVGQAGRAGPAVWGQIFGNWGETDSDGNAGKLNRQMTGFVGGADKLVGETARVGVAVGYSRSDFDVDERRSSGDSDDLRVAVYAGTKIGAVDLRATAAYGWQQVETDRTVIVGGLTDHLTADYNASTTSASLETSIDFGRVIVWTPFAGVGIVNVNTDGFTEQGGLAALTVEGSNDTLGVTTLGLRAGWDSKALSVHAGAGWQHTFGDLDPSTRMAFASAPAGTFTVAGVPASQDALAVEAGGAYRLDEHVTFALSYAGDYSSDARDHALKAEINFQF
tara:strand:- start:721 stop:3600 length:2880 start_codon:yes stop_codon:yes gene_type:complete